MIDKNQVLLIVKNKGPVLPRDIVQEIGGDTFLVGAVLSELVHNQEIRLSHTKIGSSPVYYASGQEQKLENLYKYLHEMEKKAYDLLKEKKVLRDFQQTPAIRVALRNIKDFGKALEVNLKGRKEIFWKWYLYPNIEAEQAIRDIIKKEMPKSVEKLEEPTEEKQHRKEPPLEKQETIREPVEKTGVLSDINQKFKEKNIEIIETEIIRKKSDIEMIIEIPSPVGKLKYFCKIKDKKKSNDKDLSSAYVQGEMKKLPVLYVTTGDLTKKAKEMLEKEFKMISVLYI